MWRESEPTLYRHRSLCDHIRIDDIYADMRRHSTSYDTSDYPIDHFLHSCVNAKVFGKFKGETNAIPPVEFIAFRSKV